MLVSELTEPILTDDLSSDLGNELSPDPSNDLSSPLCLYVYDDYGRTWGGQTFERSPLFPSEEIPTSDAKEQADRAIARGREVRITNSNQRTVFRAVNGRVLYPQNPTLFWNSLL